MIVIRLALGISGGIGRRKQTVVLVIPIGGRLAECVCRGSLTAVQVIGANLERLLFFLVFDSRYVIIYSPEIRKIINTTNMIDSNVNLG